MYYIFILESIGTSELVLIGLIALIVFGPRKLPEFARTIGKLMTEFRSSTDDFKKTWAREVDFESDENPNKTNLNSPTENPLMIENSIQKNTVSTKSEILAPEIREVSQAEFQANLPQKEVTITNEPENKQTDKRDWL